MVDKMETQQGFENLYTPKFWDKVDKLKPKETQADSQGWEEPNQIDCDYIEVMEIETEYQEE